MARDVSVLSYVTQFLDCFFWKLPQFHTSKFHSVTVVWQHTKGMVGSIIRFFVIFLSFQQGNNFENQLRIDKVIAMSLAY